MVSWAHCIAAKESSLGPRGSEHLKISRCSRAWFAFSVCLALSACSYPGLRPSAFIFALLQPTSLVACPRLCFGLPVVYSWLVLRIAPTSFSCDVAQIWLCIGAVARVAARLCSSSSFRCSASPEQRVYLCMCVFVLCA